MLDLSCVRFLCPLLCVPCNVGDDLPPTLWDVTVKLMVHRPTQNSTLVLPHAWKLWGDPVHRPGEQLRSLSACCCSLLNAGCSHRFPFSETKARLGWRGQPSALRYPWYLPQVKTEGSHAGWKPESFWEKIVLPFACPRQTCLNWVLSILQFEFYQVFIKCRFSQLDCRVSRLWKHHACGFSIFAFNTGSYYYTLIVLELDVQTRQGWPHFWT